MSAQSFQTLVGLFPNLGAQGASVGGQACAVASSFRPTLDAAVAGYDPDLRAAVSSWVANNEHMMPFLVARDAAAKASARAKCIQGHTERCIRAGCTPAAAAKAGEDFASLVEGHGVRLKAGVTTPLFPNQPITLYRGTAVLLSEFQTRWAPGATFDRPFPLACTLSPDFVPLHFAWKQHNLLRDASPNDPIASIILKIEIAAGPASPLIWAGFVPKGAAKTDFGWQQEIIAPPNFRFTVTGHAPYPGASGNLYLVDATGSFT